MVKCAKRGCKAHALRGKKYCLFHTNQYKSRSYKSTSKKAPRRKPRANFRSRKTTSSRRYKSYSKRY